MDSDEKKPLELSDFQKLALAFGQTFSTESGQQVLKEFERLSNRPSYEPGMEDPDRAPYWHEGRRSVLLLCRFMMEAGEKVMEAVHMQDQSAVNKLAGQAVSILDESEES